MSKISGAIFDCDGTLLDSMSMWYDMFDELFRSYGLEPTSEVIDKVEAMTSTPSLAWAAAPRSSMTTSSAS